MAVDTTERVAQSRRALTSAVIDLLRTSPAGRITITEVCRRANVTRPTFYQHYASLDDLVGRAVAERLREHQQAALALDADVPDADLQASIGRFLDRIWGDRNLVRALRNTGAAPRTVEAALHTYLAVGDVTAVSITGLEGARYSDRLTDEERVQDGPIRFSGRVDRIYRARGPVAVTDPAGARRIVVTGVRAPNAVVWNPWSRVAATMADLGEEWPSMVCVESAAVRDRAVRLEPGESTSLGARIGVEPLA